jgi:hypothetical protein
MKQCPGPVIPAKAGIQELGEFSQRRWIAFQAISQSTLLAGSANLFRQ